MRNDRISKVAQCHTKSDLITNNSKKPHNSQLLSPTIKGVGFYVSFSKYNLYPNRAFQIESSRKSGRKERFRVLLQKGALKKGVQ